MAGPVLVYWAQCSMSGSWEKQLNCKIQSAFQNKNTYSHRHTRRCTHTCTHMQSQPHIHVHSHIHMPSHVHTHVCTHTHSDTPGQTQGSGDGQGQALRWASEAQARHGQDWLLPVLGTLPSHQSQTPLLKKRLCKYKLKEFSKGLVRLIRKTLMKIR